MIRLLIVDDEALVRRGIKSLVDFKKLNIYGLFLEGTSRGSTSYTC